MTPRSERERLSQSNEEEWISAIPNIVLIHRANKEWCWGNFSCVRGWRLGAGLAAAGVFQSKQVAVMASSHHGFR